jgi:hypothetical protein
MYSRTRLVALVALLAVAACSNGSDTDVGDEQLAEPELATATKVLEAKLYTEPQPYPAPNSLCDEHVAAEVLRTASGKLRLRLENRVVGGCRIAVRPDTRIYSIAESNDCGSKVYAGTRGAGSVELMDNRTRLCKDLRPAQLELRETRNGKETLLYGDPAAATAPDAQLLDVKLYTTPGTQVIEDAFCDQYTRLALKRTNNVLEARLVNELSKTSRCRVVANRDERVFTVTESNDCGSKVYTSAAGADRVVITDNSTRLCENVVAARVVVELTKNDATKSLYSPQE